MSPSSPKETASEGRNGICMLELQTMSSLSISVRVEGRRRLQVDVLVTFGPARLTLGVTSWT